MNEIIAAAENEGLLLVTAPDRFMKMGLTELKKQDDPVILYYLGLYSLLFGNGVKLEIILDYFERSKLPEAYYMMGKLQMNYCLFDQMKQNFLKAIAGGISRGATDLGFYYHHNTGEKNNRDTAKIYYNQAISLDSTKALYNLGMLYYEDGNIEEMKRLWRQAAIHNDLAAVRGLGILYEREKDWDNMLTYYQQGVKLGDLQCAGGLYDYYNK